MGKRALSIVIAAAFVAASAQAVLIESGGPGSNRTAPSPDPGFPNVGTGNGLSVVYIGRGWVLSAAHVGEVRSLIDGQWYSPIPDSRVVLKYEGSTESDLEIFRIDPYPKHLPELAIRERAVAAGDLALLIGHGHERGDTVEWPKPGRFAGYRWTGKKAIRWGTNIVENAGLDIDAFGKRTRSFNTLFEPGGSPHEAQATRGDSGGAAFAKHRGRWELAGIIWGVTGLPGQPKQTALYGSRTFAADLSWYREQIVEIMTPACGNGHVTIDEECDDGNDVDGDCCSATCRIESVGVACDDGLGCNGPDVCSERGSCEPTGPAPCDDGDPCTEDVCREPASCSHTPLTTPECAQSTRLLPNPAS